MKQTLTLILYPFPHRLKEEMRAQSDELLAQQTCLRDSHVALSDAQCRLLPLQLELSKTAREKELLQQSVEVLEQQLEVRTTDLGKSRRESSSHIAELENELRTTVDDKKALHSSVKSLQEQLKSQELKLDSFLKRTKDLETDAAKMISTHLHEMKEKDKMVQLCKMHREEAHAKIEELENSLVIAKESSARQFSQHKDKIEALVAKNKESLAAEKASSEEQIRVLTEKLSDVSRDIPVVPFESSQVVTVAAHLEFESMGVTAMYNRVVIAERERDEANLKRTEAEIFLGRILKDVECKAPIIAAKQRDLNRVLEINGQLSKRLDEVLLEVSTVQERLEKADSINKSSLEEVQSLEQANKDLSAQVQHLLKASLDRDSKGSQSTSAYLISSESTIEIDQYEQPGNNGVVSNYLMTFKDVAELQARNEQLLKVVRKLSLDYEKSINANHIYTSNGTSESESVNKETLEALTREIKDLREAREMTEQMALGLVQQNEMYKVMLAEQDAHLLSRSNAITSPRITNSGDHPLALTKTKQDLMWKLTQSEEEKNRLRDKQVRMEESEKLLNETLERARMEAGTLRLEKAQAVSEARHQAERASRLEETLKVAQDDCSTALQRRLDLDRLLLELQKECRCKDDRAADLQEKLRDEQDARRRAEIETDVSKTSFARMEKAMADQREEIKRQAALVESVHNIETSLAQRTEEERISLLMERDSLLRIVESLRKREADKALVDDQRLKALEDDLRSARSRADERAAELSSLKEEVLRCDGTARAAQERCSLLEKQLTLSQERLESVQGSQTMDTILQREAAEREAALEQALAEVASLKTQLVSEKCHAEQFQQISAKTEATLKELQRRSEEIKAAQDDENKALKLELEASNAELLSSRQSSLGIVEELNSSREALRLANKEHADAMRLLTEEYEMAKLVSNSFAERENVLKADIVKCQQETRDARNNYQRELQLHASAEKHKSEVEKDLDNTKIALDQALQTSAELSANLIRHERLLAEEKSKAERSVVELRDKVEELRTTNDALHSQIEQLSSRVARATELRNDDTTSAAASAAAAEGDAELRKSVDQLLLLLKREKQDRQLAEGKLSVAESENASQSQVLVATQRALDETRAALYRESEERERLGANKLNTELDKLRADNSQLALIRESNSHLRAENEDLAKSVEVLRGQLESSRAKEKPLENTIRRFEAEKEALLATITRLDSDATFWKDKVAVILSRQNDVDPDEHNLVKEKLAVAIQEIADTKAALSAREQEIVSKEEELTSSKSLVASLEATADKFRNQMRKVMEDKRSTMEKLKAAEAERSQLQATIEMQMQQLDAAQQALTTATSASPQPQQKGQKKQTLLQVNAAQNLEESAAPVETPALVPTGSAASRKRGRGEQPAPAAGAAATASVKVAPEVSALVTDTLKGPEVTTSLTSKETSPLASGPARKKKSASLPVDTIADKAITDTSSEFAVVSADTKDGAAETINLGNNSSKLSALPDPSAESVQSTRTVSTVPPKAIGRGRGKVGKASPPIASSLDGAIAPPSGLASTPASSMDTAVFQATSDPFTVSEQSSQQESSTTSTEIQNSNPPHSAENASSEIVNSIEPATDSQHESLKPATTESSQEMNTYAKDAEQESEAAKLVAMKDALLKKRQASATTKKITMQPATSESASNPIANANILTSESQKQKTTLFGSGAFSSTTNPFSFNPSATSFTPNALASTTTSAGNKNIGKAALGSTPSFGFGFGAPSPTFGTFSGSLLGSKAQISTTTNAPSEFPEEEEPLGEDHDLNANDETLTEEVTAATTTAPTVSKSIRPPILFHELS